MGFEGEETFRGRGVAYCATCDGGFFTDRDVFVVGGGFAAAEEAMFLTRYARSVTMLVRRSTLSCAESIAEQVLAHESVRVRFNTVLEAVEGDTALRRAVFRDTVTGRLETYAPPEGETFGVFVFAGYEPASRLAEGLAELTGQGNIVTDREQRTRTEGVYAAGDVCDKRLRQVVTAVSDGAVAATSIERYAADMQRKTGLAPAAPGNRPGVFRSLESLSPFRECPRDRRRVPHGGAAGTACGSLRPHGTPAHPEGGTGQPPGFGRSAPDAHGACGFDG